VETPIEPSKLLRPYSICRIRI